MLKVLTVLTVLKVLKVLKVLRVLKVLNVIKVIKVLKMPKVLKGLKKLKVIKGPFSAVVSLSRFELTLHAHGYYVHQYKIGIGKPGTTPVGRFTIQEKLRNPTYYGPDGVVAADNPENPLGERWLGLGDGYGIHGTIEPASIGRAVSRGCVRMHAADVAEVYDLLEVGSEVIIRR